MRPLAELKEERNGRISGQLSKLSQGLSRSSLQEEGSLIRMVGIKLEAVGCQAPLGGRCRIETDEGHSVEEMLAAEPTRDLDPRWGGIPSWTAVDLLPIIYQELTQ
mgnify:CR=1 FL=1